MMLTLLIATNSANAFVDPACQEVADAGPPADYVEQEQQDYLLNFFALATTLSPLHAPVPHKPGTGGVGIELSVIPPLSCEQRLVLNYTKTEDTNKAPVAPRPRISFSFPKIGEKIVPYAGLGYIPPVTVFGTRNVIVSAEAGFGVTNGEGLQWGARYHATLMKTVAEIATPFDENAESVDDLYIGSTFGADLMGGWRADRFTPYAAIGFTDVSTFFYIGDDGIVGNNYDPYAGVAISAGVQYRASEHIQLAGEFYTAPGVIYTGRFRASWIF
jgi:hypothetical protein